MYWFLQANYELVETFFRGGSNQNMQIAKVMNMEIPLPSIETQQQLIDMFDKYLEDKNQYFENINQQCVDLEKILKFYRFKLFDFKRETTEK